MTLSSLFGQDSGFVVVCTQKPPNLGGFWVQTIVQDTVVFAAEVFTLKETFSMKDCSELINSGFQINPALNTMSYIWKMEKFLSFSNTLETNNIVSQKFWVGGCELHIGIHKILEHICAYLQCHPSVDNDPDNNFLLVYGIAFVNQKNTSESKWKVSTSYTKSCSNSVLQIMKISDLLDADKGFLVHESIVLVCKIASGCPLSEFSEPVVLASHDSQNEVSADIRELIHSKHSEEEVFGEDKEELLRTVLARAGFDLAMCRANSSNSEVTDEILIITGWICRTVNGLNNYLEEPVDINDLICAIDNVVVSELEVSGVDDVLMTMWALGSIEVLTTCAH